MNRNQYNSIFGLRVIVEVEIEVEVSHFRGRLPPAGPPFLCPDKEVEKRKLWAELVRLTRIGLARIAAKRGSFSLFPYPFSFEEFNELFVIPSQSLRIATPT